MKENSDSLKIGGSPRDARLRVLKLTLLFEGALIVLALVLNWFMERSLWDMIGFDWFLLWAAPAAILPLLAVFYWTLDSSIRMLREVRESLGAILPSMFGASKTMDLLLVSILAGVGEELLFRGVFQTALTNMLGPFAGLILASVLFGLGHWITPGYALLAGLAGVFLGLLFQFTDNLLLPVLVHILYDFTALTYYMRRHRMDGDI